MEIGESVVQFTVCCIKNNCEFDVEREIQTRSSRTRLYSRGTFREVGESSSRWLRLVACATGQRYFSQSAKWRQRNGVRLNKHEQSVRASDSRARRERNGETLEYNLSCLRRTGTDCKLEQTPSVLWERRSRQPIHRRIVPPFTPPFGRSRSIFVCCKHP